MQVTEQNMAELTDYYAELQVTEERWLLEEIERWKKTGRGRICGSSPWNANRHMLLEIDRRHGIVPEDPRVYSIATYQVERQRILNAWQEVCDTNGWLADRKLSPTRLRRHALARHAHDCRLDDLDARHFGRLNTDRIELSSTRLLWAHIVRKAIPRLSSCSIPAAGMTRAAPSTPRWKPSCPNCMS